MTDSGLIFVANWRKYNSIYYSGLFLKSAQWNKWIGVVDSLFSVHNVMQIGGVQIPRRYGRHEGNVLFNDALNTFYLRLYGVGHMVKNHSDSERGNPLPPHGLLFPISCKGSFIRIIPQAGQHIPRPLLHQSWSTS